MYFTGDFCTALEILAFTLEEYIKLERVSLIVAGRGSRVSSRVSRVLKKSRVFKSRGFSKDCIIGI